MQYLACRHPDTLQYCGTHAIFFDKVVILSKQVLRDTGETSGEKLEPQNTLKT